MDATETMLGFQDGFPSWRRPRPAYEHGEARRGALRRRPQTGSAPPRLTIVKVNPALAFAAVLVWRRAPFLIVVLGGAGTAALLRAFG